MLHNPLLFYFFTVIVNVVLLVCVIDVHYRIPGNPPFIKKQCLLHTNTTQTSKRLVFFLVDGLRSDSFYEVTGAMHNSFIRKKMKNGTWGISNTDLPTLTRQGTFAILSGKPFSSSDMFGKLTNMFSINSSESRVPDNVLNYTKNVFYAGHKGVADYFEKQSNSWLKKEFMTSGLNCRLHFACYDRYTFQKVNETLKNNTFMKNGNDMMIFVHLYGQDYCGHNKRPLSKECKEEIKVIDTNVKAVANEIEKIFNDSLTTYLLTSDHGMTDGGVHGWDSKEETQTPFVLWGHGVSKAGNLNDSHKSWKTENLTRYDLDQIDLAPLLSVLLGKPIPKESLGTLHLDIISYDEELKAKAMFCYAKGVQYLVDAMMTENYTPNIEMYMENIQSIKNRTKNVEQLLKFGNFTKVISSSKLLFQEGLGVYANITQDVYREHLIIVISSAYVGWGLYLLTEFILFPLKQTSNSKVHNVIIFLFVIFTTGITMLSVISKTPLRFIFYYHLSIGCWLCFSTNVIKILEQSRGRKLSLQFILSSNFHEKVASFGLSFVVIFFVNRRYVAQYALVFMTLSFLFRLSNKIPGYLLGSWICSAIIMMLVTQYPILDPLPNLTYTQMGTVGWIFLVVLYIYYGNGSKRDSFWSFASLFNIIISIINVTAIAGSTKLDSKDQKQNEPYKLSSNLTISWTLLAISIFYPIFSGQKSIKRVFHLVFALGTPFILMSVSQEPLGLLGFAIHVISWVALEIRTQSSDTWRGFYFLFYVWIGFFAIGNDDQPTSFAISWTRCFFITVGDFMIPLILYKQLIPVIILIASAITIYKKENRNLFPMLIWYLFLNNGIALYFFLCTKGKNYAETTVGFSYMHHILSQCFPISVILLMPLVNLLLTVELPKEKILIILSKLKKTETQNEINTN